MKRLVKLESNILELEDVPIKEVGPEDIKVKVDYCAISGVDICIIDFGLTGMLSRWPMGCQGSGTIVEVGKNATTRGLKVGDRVALNQLRSCGACPECIAGHEAFCSKGFPYGWMDSLMAEYAVYNQQQIYKLPDSINLEEGALTEVVAASMQGIDLAQIKMGNSVFISGGGSNGLALLQLARLQGGTKLTVVEPVEGKRKLALKLGADYVIDPKNQDIAAEAMKITENKGFDRIIEASGNTEAINPCFDIIGTCGKVILFGTYPASYKLCFDIDKIYMREASVQTVFGYSYMFPRAIDLLTKLDLKSMLGPVYPLKDYKEAFKAHRTGKYPKVLLKC